MALAKNKILSKYCKLFFVTYLLKTYVMGKIIMSEKLLKLMINYLAKIDDFISSIEYPAVKNVVPWNIIKNNKACRQTLYFGRTKCL